MRTACAYGVETDLDLRRGFTQRPVRVATGRVGGSGRPGDAGGHDQLHREGFDSLPKRGVVTGADRGGGG